MTGETRSVFGKPNYWRYSATMPRLLFFDARLVFSFLLLVFHLRAWTAGFLVLNALVLWGVEHYGYRLPNAFRLLRSTIAGRMRPAMPSARYREARDFGFETHPLTADRMARLREELERSTRQRLGGRDPGPVKAERPSPRVGSNEWQYPEPDGTVPA